MPLTTAQLQTLKTDIIANTNVMPAGQPFAGTQVKDITPGADGNIAVAWWYNQVAAPDWIAWKRLVALADIAKKLNGSELAGLTSLNHTRLQTVVTLINASGGLDASLPDMRQFFDDIFSGAGGATTRASLLALWKRQATNAQKLFSTGTGSDAQPATTASNIGDAFILTATDVANARNS